MHILLTGATGYIGGRLAPRLIAAGHQVRCLARHPDRLRDVPWRAQAEVVAGDVMDPSQLEPACAEIDVAYYLVHSMPTGKAFAEKDRAAAQNFARAAEKAGIRTIIYLGGLAPEGTELSEHMRSRTEVADLLLESAVPAIVLRASVILGSGSASFEMLRYLTERLPAMVTPRWVRNRVQPIGIRDVLRYLLGALDLPTDSNRTFDIGGPQILSYDQLIQLYARTAGLKRRIIVPTPFLSPWLSSHWVGLVTPVPNALARPLVESLRHESIVHEHDIARYIPDPPDGLMSPERAITLALRRIQETNVETRWSAASWPGAPSDPLPQDPHWAGGSLYRDERVAQVKAPSETLWRIIEGIGGETGWYSWPFAWTVRGWFDRAIGGVGLRRGRRNPHRLHVGESLDFWRVEEVIPQKLLRLRAEMRLPGLAWLEFSLTENDDRTSGLRQRALFHPRGLLGHLYWWTIAPWHGLVFGGMRRNITKAAENAANKDG
ncbi:MAG: SDR family oxidoreductase [Corynebacteriales bacterium]|nr:SDR family oxidoreductase [Mycobacteriales bacterium]